MMPSDPRKAIQEEMHNALADCYYQQNVFNQHTNILELQMDLK